MKFDFNEKQKQVLEYDFDKNNKSLLVSAAAGSGKTRVLTEKILGMITDSEKNITLNDILIMTFTVKATNEMKSRIKLSIDKRIQDGNNVEKLIKESASIQNAPISTIDSFCKSIVDKYYNALNEDDSIYKGFDPNYRIADEKELNIMYDDVLDKMLEEIVYSDEKYSNFVNSYFRKNSDEKIKNELFFAGLKFLDSIPEPLVKLKKYAENCDNDLSGFINELDEKYKKELYDVISLIKKESANIINDLIGIKDDLDKRELEIKNKVDVESFGKVLDDIKLSKNNILLLSNIVENIDFNKKTVDEILDILFDKDFLDKYINICKVNGKFSSFLIAKTNMASGNKKVDVEFKESYDTKKKNILRLKEIIDVLNKRITNNEIVKFNNNPNEKVFIELLSIFYRNVIKEKVKRNLYAISDYSHLALSILNTKKYNVEAIIKEKYKYIFVDEYQDTSNIQEEILKKISKGNNMFFVGDVKQSIYGFRNAEPKNFLKKIYAANYDKLGKEFKGDFDKNLIDISDLNKYEIITMDINYRSSYEIITFVNELFGKVMNEEFSGINYDRDGKMNVSDIGLEKNAIDEDKKVEIDIVCDKKIDEYYILKNELDVRKNSLKNIIKSKSATDEEKQNAKIECNNIDTKLNELEKDYLDLAKSPAETEAEFIAKTIYNLVEVEKKMHYKDFVVLFRSFYSKADIYIDALSKYNIPVFTDMKKGFFDRLEIKLMIDILNVIDNDYQDIPVISVLCSNIYRLTNNEILFLKYIGLEFDIKDNISDIITEFIQNFDKYNKFFKESDYKNFEKHNINLDKLYDKLFLYTNNFSYLREKSRYYSISELIYEIYDLLDIRNIMLSMSDGGLRVANLDILYDFAKKYENASYVGLFNFLRYIEKIKELREDQGLAKISDENDDVVRIMTLHSSKGLEFKCVIVAGAAKIYNTNDTKSDAVMQNEIDKGIALDYYDLEKGFVIETLRKKEMAEMKKLNIYKEEMRMFYVALTRAKEKLIIVGALSKNGKGSVSYKSMMDTIKKYDNNEFIDIDPRDCKSYIELMFSMRNCKYSTAKVKCEFIDFIENDENNTLKLDYDKIIEMNPNNMNVEDSRIVSILDELESSKLDSNINFNYKYDYLNTITKTKYSVSDLKSTHLSLINDKKKNGSTNIYENDYTDDIDLIELRKTEITRKDSTVIGNIYHKIMQFYDFKSIDSNDKIFDYIGKDIDELSSTEIENIKNKINLFCNSDFGLCMSDAYKNDNLYREHKFMKLLSIDEINGFINDSSENNIMIKDDKSKNIVLQGIVDAFFIKDGKITLVDYKTDGINGGNAISEKKLIDNYKIQVDIYATVLKELTGLEIDKKYIYSFALDKAIEII